MCNSNILIKFDKEQESKWLQNTFDYPKKKCQKTVA